MKRKIRFIDHIHNKETVTEVNVAEKDHLAAQIKYPAKVIKPKKGKGSWRRKRRISSEEME